MNAIEKAAKIVGGVSALARALGVSYQLVRFWSAGERAIQPLQCVLVERVTGGKVSRMDLRPDDWFVLWPELAERHPGRADRARAARDRATAHVQ